MRISFRLDAQANAMLENTARLLQTTKTEVLRRAVEEFCNQAFKKKRKTPYDLIQDLVGEEANGKGDLSVRGEEILRGRLARQPHI